MIKVHVSYEAYKMILSQDGFNWDTRIENNIFYDILFTISIWENYSK